MYSISDEIIDKVQYIYLTLIFLFFTYFYWHFSGWPIGTHPDEAKKAYFVISGLQDFRHPILMIQLGRLANAFAGFQDPSYILQIGRGLSAIFGGLTIIATFVLGRVVRLTRLASGAVATAAAVTPLLTVHATFYKEDIFVAPSLLLGVAALISFTDKPSMRRALTLGLVIGLAVSAKYIGTILLPLSVLIILIASNGNLGDRLKAICLITASAFLVFLAINFPLFLDPDVFSSGLNLEINHALSGHGGMALPLTVTYGVMFLTQSLAPGLGLPLLGICLLGFIAPAIDIERRRALLIVISFVLVWYFVHEASPMKPFGIEKYMVPVAPMALVIGVAFLEKFLNILRWRHSQLIICLIIAISASSAFYSTLRIVGFPRTDARAAIAAVAPVLGPGVRFTLFSVFDRRSAQSAAIGPHNRPAPTDTIVVSSIYADRIIRFAQRAARAGGISRFASMMELLLEDTFNKRENPYLSISNGRLPFFHLNRKVYIISINGNYRHLQRIKDSILSFNSKIDRKLLVELH